MKSPEGLIWNTPARRKAFRREATISRAELDQIWEELDAAEATHDCGWPPRLVLVTPERPGIEPSTGLGMS